MYRVFKALSESNVTTAQAYAGDVGIARVTQAFSSLIGTAVTAVPVLITGIITMAWIALTFALYITGPFKLAPQSAHSPQKGQNRPPCGSDHHCPATSGSRYRASLTPRHNRVALARS